MNMKKTGVTHNSRRQSNFINRMTPEQRERHIIQFIAACEAQELIPYIKITKHDKYFREIEYTLEIPGHDNV
jgi:hypothetical protein